MEESQVFTVSQLTELIKTCLESGFGEVRLEAEISNCKISSTGHLYCTLKDEGAAISAVVFKNRLRSLSFIPKDGMMVRAKGNLSVYPQRGTYQLVCDELEQAGSGKILAILEERKRKLAAEGLFDQDRKKPVPPYPQSVAVVSSPNGAALRDILNVLNRRAQGIHVIILPAPVQGLESGNIIAQRIKQANFWHLADVLIVGRGGGSLEDLLPFSEETVVRAAAESEIPLISAVGHEIDWALLDYAADLRAPTPSAAAELVSANRAETLLHIQALAEEMERNIQRGLEKSRLLLKPFAPEDLEFRFRSILQPHLVRFDDAKEILVSSLQERINSMKNKLFLLRETLQASSPLSILERGYAVVSDAESGKIIHNATDTKPGKELIIRPGKGSIRAITKECIPEEE